MKYLFKLLVLCVLFGSCTPLKVTEGNATRKQVYLFAGQSNMDGRANGAHLSEVDLQRLADVADRISFYYNHQPVSPLQLTVPSKYIQKKFELTQSFGPELFLGIELAEKYPKREFVFIKRAKGGTSLYGCWHPEWSEEKASLMNESDQPRLYSDLIDYVKNTLAEYAAAEYEIKGLLWVQGEADSGVRKWGKKPSETYGDNLRNLIAAARRDVGVSDLPFVMFQVGGGKVVEGMKQVAEEDEHAYLIVQSKEKESSDYYVKNPPPIGHYTAESMKKIGVNFFKVFNSLENKKDR